MKIKDGFILRNVIDEYIVMPTGDNIGKYNGTVILNEVSAFVWNLLQQPSDYDAILQAILSEYEIDEATARNDLDDLLAKFRAFEVLE